MKVGEFFAELAGVVGVDTTNEVFKDILASQAEIPKEFIDKYKAANLMTEEVASHSPNIKNKFYKAALDPIDQDIKRAFDEYKLSDEAKAEIERETSTYKKNALLRKKIVELEALKAGAGDKDKEGFKTEIKKLNDQIVQNTEKHKKEIEDFNKGLDDRLLSYAIKSNLATRKFPNDKMPQKVKVKTAYDLLNETAKEKGMKIIFGEDKETIKLVRADNPELDVTVNNKILTYETFADQTLADNGLTIVSASGNGNGSHSIDINKIPEGQRPPAELLKEIAQM